MRDWSAPAAAGPVRATVTLPGSKSLTNRLLVLGALAAGRTRLVAPLRSRDTELMAAGLRALGARVDDDGADWTVSGWAEPSVPVDGHVDVGNAGTVLRFLPPVAALAHGSFAFDGDPRARERPVGPLLVALRALGGEVADGGRGALPFTVRGGGGLAGGAVTLDASASSQLLSGLLLPAPRYARGLVLRHAGPPVPSTPHLRMTVAELRRFGAVVDDAAPATWRVRPGPLAGRTVAVEPDLSSAAPFLAAAAVTGGSVTVTGWPAATTQPGAALPELLAATGASASLSEAGLTVTGGGTVHGVDLDLRDCPEAAPVLAAVAALAAGPSRLRGIAHLRLQETDRLAALRTELGALGAEVTETADGLRIRPRPLHAGTFHTYDDHRLAMAAAVVGLRVPGVVVENVATTAKTLPGFAARWERMLAGEAGR